MNIKNIQEYNGQWHKKGKDNNCEPFTMTDLKELLRGQKAELLKKIEGIEVPYGCLQVKEQLEDIKKLLK